MSHLKIATFNLENLFLVAVDQEVTRTSLKSSDKTSKLSRTIKRISPDILFACEVGGIDSLKKLNSQYLDDQYIPSVIEGNSDRGIEIGYLINKDLELHCEQYTHRNRGLHFLYPHEKVLNQRYKDDHPKWTEDELPYQDHLLSRDIAEMRFYAKEDVDKKGPPLLITLGVHLKSKWDQDGIDEQGRLRRGAEAKLLIKTYQDLKKRWPQTHIFLLGDFNGVVNGPNNDKELSTFHELEEDLVEVLEYLNLPYPKRATYILFTPSGTSPQQLDYIYFPKKLADQVVKEESGIFYYQDEEGNALALPQNPYQRHPLPSDHYPLVLTLKSFH
tara:strand:- start:24187 stop:25176 length:990 start_codon:yes stop_codon:yes gene_type:complete